MSDPDIPPERYDARFNFWVNQSISQHMDLFDEAGLMSFDELIQRFQLSKKDFFTNFTN